MPKLILLLLVCIWAALAPWFASDIGDGGAIAKTHAGNEAGARTGVQGGDGSVWPEHWEGQILRPLSLTAQERKFSGAFPGSMARFTNGSEEILFRRVDVVTRKLHPSSDCLRAAGYAIQPQPAETSDSGPTWSCFLASRDGEVLQVKEMVVAGTGGAESATTWSDIYSWYWQVFWSNPVRGRSDGPWTAITVSRKIPVRN